jgi:hypothetical protein
MPSIQRRFYEFSHNSRNLGTVFYRFTLLAADEKYHNHEQKLFGVFNNIFYILVSYWLIKALNVVWGTAIMLPATTPTR